MTVRRQLFAVATIAAAALLSAGAAFAAPGEAWAGVGIGEGEVLRAHAPIQSTLSRAEVVAQVGEARRQSALPAAGELASLPVVASAQPTRARAEVKRETVQALRSGDTLGAGEGLQAARPAAPAASRQQVAGLR